MQPTGGVMTDFTLHLSPEFLAALRQRLLVKSISGNAPGFADQLASRIVELIDEGECEWTPRLTGKGT